jgi:hypothetical protein
VRIRSGPCARRTNCSGHRLRENIRLLEHQRFLDGLSFQPGEIGFYIRAPYAWASPEEAAPAGMEPPPKRPTRAEQVRLERGKEYA